MFITIHCKDLFLVLIDISYTQKKVSL